MEKRTIIIFLSVVLFITTICVLLHNNYQANLYKEIQQDINAGNWINAKIKLENLANLETRMQLLYKVNLEIGNEKYKEKDYKVALIFYKNSQEINSEDKTLEDKIRQTELLAAKQELQEAYIKKQKDEEKQKESIKQKVDKGAITPIPTVYGKGYDKTINRYGIANIMKINALMPKAAELIAENPSCYRVLDVDVSDERSTRNSIVMYVDCGNMESFSNFERFYVSENDINQRKQTSSIREQMDKNKDLYLNACQAEIKSRLIHPATYKTNLLVNSAIEAQSFSTIVNIDFKAKNSYGLETPFNAICRYNVKNQLVDIKINEITK